MIPVLGMDKTSDYGVAAKWYYSLELMHSGEEYSIFFPCYELSVFEHLTGLKCAEGED